VRLAGVTGGALGLACGLGPQPREDRVTYSCSVHGMARKDPG
jgi:hypothetical protein